MKGQQDLALIPGSLFEERACMGQGLGSRLWATQMYLDWVETNLQLIS